MGPIVLLIFLTFPSAILSDGVIVSLPPISESGKVEHAVPKVPDKAIHSWRHVKEGYKLDCSISSSNENQYSVEVFYQEALLDTMEATRFDGELTKSITVKSTNTSVHVVRYLLTDGTCRMRYYSTLSDGKGFERTESNCRIPSLIRTAHKKKLRKNKWLWTEAERSNGITEYWTSAILELPDVNCELEPVPPTAFKLHTWTNAMPQYKLLVYRVYNHEEAVHYAAIYHSERLLQSGIKISRFDDDLLNSISVDQTPTEHPQIKFKVPGEIDCKDRLYVDVTDKPMGETSQLKVTETTCSKFDISNMYNHVQNVQAMNGWNY